MRSDLSLQNIERIVNNEIQEHIDISKSIQDLIPDILKATTPIVEAIRKGKKLLICGNGGSAADAQHFSSELIGRFEKQRKALAAISLSTDSSIITSVSNDFSFENIFSRQIEGLGQSGDVLIAISTSGNSKNIFEAVKKAREKKIKTIGLLGKNGGRLLNELDFSIKVNSQRTARIQEMHILIIHIICVMLEKDNI